MSKTCIKVCLLMVTVLFCLFFVITPAEAQEPTYRLGALISGYSIPGGKSTGANLYRYLTSYGFSDIAIQFRVPPSGPWEWQSWKTYLKDLIDAAEADGYYGQKARIWWVLGCYNGITANEWLGTIKDFLSTIGPNHWGFMGGYLRSEFIYRGVPLPSSLEEFKAQWLNVKAIFNSYGYNWGLWSSDFGPIAIKFPQLYDPVSQCSFVEGPVTVSTTISWNPDNTKGTQYTYEDFSQTPLKYPTAVGVVAQGMWDNAWFTPNQPPYYVTYEKMEAAFRGYYDAYQKDPNKCQTLFFKIMPILFDKTVCPYLDWWSQFCAKYNVRLYNSPPPMFTPPTPIQAPPYPFPPYPVCQPCTVTPTIDRGNVGGGVNPIMYPGETFRISGQSINLANGQGLANKLINFYVQRPGSLVGELYGSGPTDSAGRFNIQGLIAPSIEGQWACYTKFEGEGSQYLSGESIREGFYIQTSGVTPPPSPTTYKLDISSSPITGVSFTLDGVTRSTPFSTSLSGGAHTIVMPRSIVIGGTSYNFKKWEDGSTSLTRVINLVSDMSVTAYYEKVVTPPSTRVLSVSSSPITGVSFTVDGTKYITPWRSALIEGTHTIVMPSTATVAGKTYNFVKWEDGTTKPTRTINLTTDATLTAYYETASSPPPPPQYSLAVQSTPMSGVQVTLDGTVIGQTPVMKTVTDGTHTISVPQEVTVKEVTYNFKRWEDASTSTTRTINLLADITMRAYYEAVVRHTLSVISFPITGISFTIDGVSHATPWSGSLTEGPHNVVMPFSVIVSGTAYYFKNWEHGSTNPTRTINLIADISIMAYYKKVAPPPPHPPPPHPSPSPPANVALNLTISWRQRTATIAIQVKDPVTNTAINGASVYIKNDTWTCETKYTNASGWANFINVEVGTYTIVGEAKGYATALDTVSVTTDITYTLLLSKRALQLAAMPIMSPDFALILMAASAFSAFSALGHFMFQRKSKR